MMQVGCLQGNLGGFLHWPGGLEGCGHIRGWRHKVQAENVPESEFTEWRAADQGDAAEQKERNCTR